MLPAFAQARRRNSDGCWLLNDLQLEGRIMLLRTRKIWLLVALLLSSSLVPVSAQMGGKEFDEAAADLAKRYLEEGKETFRFDTFGSEDFWGGQLKLHQAILGEK